MKIYIKLIRVYLNTLSYIAPNYGGKVALRLFSKVRLKNIKEKEQSFYEKAKHFKVAREKEEVFCYEMGNPEGKLVFFVHGWESNVGCLSNFAFAMENDYRIIGFNIPAHAKSEEKYTNMYEGKEAFKLLLKHINPSEKFSVVSHSFGSAITGYALSEVDYKADNLVFLTSNNKIEQVFFDFQKMIGFNEKLYNVIKKKADLILGEDLSKLEIAEKLKEANFDDLLLIHDTKDKMISYSNAVEIHEKVPNSTLNTHTKIGHYRMLWNQDVLNETLIFLSK